MNTLHLRFERENEWDGELVASVSTKGFKAKASAWFNTDELRHFSHALTLYPLRDDALPYISGGFGGEPGAQQPKQVHLAIDVAPHDARGALRVTVRLASKVWTSEESDLGCSAVVRFLATYGDIAPFASAVSALAEGQVDEAVLQTTV